MQHTPEQASVISAGCQNILVSAAAGSGKTAVMTDRIVRRVVNGDLDLRQVLVVTFTEAAARNMREKIETKLRTTLAEEADPGRRQKISRQISWLPGAAISTIHDFCLSVIRDFYYCARDQDNNPLIEPGFTVDDGIESDLLLRQTLDEWLNSRYEAIDLALEGNSPDLPDIRAFYRLMEGYGDNRGDQPVRDLMIALHRFLRSLPDYDRFTAERITELVQAAADFPASPHCRALLRQLRLRLDRALDSLPGLSLLLDGGVRFIADAGRDQVYHQQFRSVFTILHQLDAYLAGEGCDWDTIRDMGRHLPVFAMPRGNSKDSPDKSSFLDRFRESVGEVVYFLSGQCGTDQFSRQFIFQTNWMFCRTAQEIEMEISDMLPAIRLLFQSVLELDRLYADQKRTAGLIDFSDFEHLALAILRQEEARQYYYGRFREIYIDEYQDTSSIQDAILQTVSENNCLMVGDIKQSIYRFRHARPMIFRHKAAAFHNLDGGRLIELNRNFRSVAGILDAVNDLFGQLMSAGAGEIDYDEHQALTVYRENTPQNPVPVEVLLLDRSAGGAAGLADPPQDSQGDTAERPEAAGLAGTAEGQAEEIEALEDFSRNQQEARLALTRIYAMIREGLHFRDIVVLARTRAVGLIWREQLELAGIPVLSDSSGGFLDTPAMRLAESLIHVLDNQRQDIPLAAVMHAGIFRDGFSLDDMAAIRLYGKSICPDDPFFHQAVLLYRQEGPDITLRQRVCGFMDWLDQLRLCEQTLRLSEMVDLAFQQTGWLDRVAAGSDGAAEVRRLRQFRLWTEQFEKNRRQGLYRFARQLESLRRREPLESPVTVSVADQDRVRIMTIHGSKGLEFPVVILAGTGFQVSGKDTQEHVLISENLGIGMDYTDPDRQIRYPATLKLAMLEEVRAAGVAEELRLLYVAMTRAMDRLILVGSVKPGTGTGIGAGKNRLQQLLARARECIGPTLPDYLVLSARSYLDWILLALVRKYGLSGIIETLAASGGSAAGLTQDIYPWSISVMTLAGLRQVEKLNPEPGSAGHRSAVPGSADPGSADPGPAEPGPAESGRRTVGFVLPEFDQNETRQRLENLEKLRENLRQRITQPYRHERAARTPIKLTVSELKRREQDLADPDFRDAAPQVLPVPPALSGPRGIDLTLNAMSKWDSSPADSAEPPEHGRQARRVKNNNAAQQGILLHSVFRYLDLVSARANPEPDEIDSQLSRMVSLGMIKPDDLETVKIYRDQILTFVRSDLAGELLRAMNVPEGDAYFEIPFTLTLPACQVYHPCDGLHPEDRVLVQGIIDCWYRLADSITLIDYKTDRISGDDDLCAKELQLRYGGQLDYYARAIETAAGIPVTRRLIWHIGRARPFQLT